MEIPKLFGRDPDFVKQQPKIYIWNLDLSDENSPPENKWRLALEGYMGDTIWCWYIVEENEYEEIKIYAESVGIFGTMELAVDDLQHFLEIISKIRSIM